jgi:DNA-directed RNA polymerase specialized sigma24 family protein
LSNLSHPRDQLLLEQVYLRGRNKFELCQELGMTGSEFDRVISRARARLKQLVLARRDQS